MRFKTSSLLAVVALAAVSALAGAQTVKVGIITTYSGPGSGQGDQLDKGFKLYLKLNGDKLPPGVKVEPVFRDDTGPNPDAAKRIAQELIVRDKVQFLTGVVWTPNAAAIAPLVAEAKVPFVSANAAGVSITRASPYIARVSFTLWQSSLSARAVGREEVQARLHRGERLCPRPRGRGSLHEGLQGSGRRDRRQRARADGDDGLHSLHAARQGRQAGRHLRVQSGRQAGDRPDEGLRRPRPQQGRYQVHRHRRHHHGRRAAEHGRRRARRAHRPPLLGSRGSPGQQGVRRRVQEGVR